ncbi:MAG: LytTR family DNA-binding domain-containing protein [Cryomorphaceae bacterium]|jgi:two-component system LytT family response regulator|nr:LytTR family DNA-binding domain-containing protein [Cryomorphaceae bacterium]
MKNVRAIIIDDERLAREELKSLLKEFHEIEVIDEAKNGEEALNKIRLLTPDLLFLDINMPEINGLELLKRLEVIPKVIFITAYDQYALSAFEVKAADYILKPIEPLRLKEALDKVLQSDDDFVSPKLNSSVRKNRKLTLSDKVFIKDGEKCWFVELSKIRMLESDGNYVKVYFDNFRPLILRSLNSLEEKLDPEYFFRANRKFIINLQWINGIENWFNGGLQVELKEGEKIEISRRQAIRFREIMSL